MGHPPMTSRLRLAFDRASARDYDSSGRLHVANSVITAAQVNGYRGDELPDWRSRGLDPDRIYKLLRDPDALRRALPTFNGLPILDRHRSVTAFDHPKEIVIGATGNDATFDGKVVRNSLVIWPAEAIRMVESGEQRDISAGYQFAVDWTPGVFDGEHYDGRMIDIVAQHVALVSDGRVEGALVGDSALYGRSKPMKYPTLRSFVCDASAIVKRRRARDEEGDPSEEDLDAPLKIEDVVKLARSFIESVPAEDAEELFEQLAELKNDYVTPDGGLDRAHRGVPGARRARGAGDRHRYAGDAAPRIKSAAERFPGLGRVQVMGG